MNRNNLLAVIITLCCIIGWGVCFGLHFGWLDDVQDLNVMKGMVINGCTIFDPDNFVMVQPVLKFLYAHIPKFPWFGTLLYAMLAYSIYTSVRLLLSGLNAGNTIAKVILALLFVICFMLESINAINFTQIAIFTSCIAVINVYYLLKDEKSGIWKIVLCLLPWVIALIIRWGVVLYITGVIAIILFFQTPKSQFKNYWKVLSVLIISSLMLLIYVKGYLEQTDEYKHIADFNSYLWTIQDAYQLNQSEVKTPEDSLLVEGLEGWNFFDKYKISPSVIKKIGYEQPIRMQVLYSLPSRFKNLFYESCKYNGYHEIYNWYIKLAFLLMINFLLLLLQLKGNIRAWKTISGHLFFWGSLLAVGIFVKMEDRFFFPVCACFTLANILFADPFVDSGITNRRSKKRILLRTGVFVSFLFFAGYMLKQNITMAAELNEELKFKRAFWREMSGFENKILVYDFHSLLLLHDSPFKEVNLPANSENIVANHYYLTHFSCLNDYYISRTGCDSINCIFNYLHSKRDRVYLIGIKYDMDFLQRYLHTVYQRDYSFVIDTSFHSTEKLRYNFLWCHLPFGVYKFKE